MFIKNKLGTYLNFKLAGKGVSMKPADVTIISDDQAEDDYLKVLIERDFIEVVEAKDHIEQSAKEEAVKEEKAREKIPVVHHDDKVTGGTVVVPCAGIYKNGKHCSSNVNVPQEEYDSDKPYFCKRHAAENPEEYEKIDGEWTRKVKPTKKSTTKKRTSTKKK